MSFDWRLLELLSDGDFHSGEEFGALLGVSRAAVWKQLQKMEEELAVQLESAKGRGYRLIGGLELLDEGQILRNIPNDLSYSLHLIRQTDSTNALAMDYARDGATRGCVVLAEQQLAGRGRRGRCWISPFARNIYCSVVWEFDSGAAALEGLSLAVGVGVIRALRELGVSDAFIKWPNDILHSQRKLAGILLEMAGDVSGCCQVVVGVGINVAMGNTDAAMAIDQPWTDVDTAAGRRISRNDLASALIVQLLRVLAEFESGGFGRFRSEWSEFDCTYRKAVTVHVGEQVLQGVAAGVDAGGALVVDTVSGRQLFHGGEVSLRVQS